MREVNLIELKDDVKMLDRYSEWLESKRGILVSKIYDENGLSKSTIPFPIYENTLLNFVNQASKSALMDENYHYVYSRNSIKTHDDERKAISGATIKDADILCGILSRYVLGGVTKGTLWAEAVDEGIFVDTIAKMKELIELWDEPFNIE